MTAKNEKEATNLETLCIADRYRMFRYPKKVVTFTNSFLDSVWSDHKTISKGEFYENGYRGEPVSTGNKPGFGDGECVSGLLNVIGSIGFIAISIGITILSFILGAIIDGLVLLMNSLSKCGSDDEANISAAGPSV